MAVERKGVVTSKGRPLTLVGAEIKVGDKALNFSVLSQSLEKVDFAVSGGKIRLISVVPSLDTGICDAQTRRFNQESANLGDNVEIWTISVDLPTAQARWCGAVGIDKVKVYSDHRDLEFGLAYGVLIKEMRQLSRTIFVVDSDDTVKYVEYVKDIGLHPDYDRAIEAVKMLT